MSLTAMASALNRISLALAILVRSSLINRSLFLLVLLAGVPVGFCGLIRGGLRYPLVNQCYFVILKTLLISVIESSLLAQYFVFALQTVFRRLQAVLPKGLAWFSCTAVLQLVFYYSWPVFQPRDLFADLMQASLIALVKFTAIRLSSSVDGVSVSARILAREVCNRSVNCSLSIVSSLSLFISSWSQELQFIVVISRLWSKVVFMCSDFVVIANNKLVRKARSSVFLQFWDSLLTSDVNAKLLLSSHATKGLACLEGEGWSRSQLGWCRLKSPAKKADCHKVRGSFVRRSTALLALVLLIRTL